MSDDDLLDALAGLGREEATVDSRLEALVRGELSEADQAALEAEADGDPELALALLAYQPVADSTKAELTSQLLAEVSKPSAGDQAKVLAFSRRRVLVVAVSAAALAAGVALFVLGDSRALPEYSLELSGIDQELRSGSKVEAEVPKVSANSRVSLLMRPRRDFAGAEGRLFVVSGDIVRRVSARVEVSETGAVRFSATAQELFTGKKGIQTLLLLVGAQGKLPQGAEAWRSVQVSGRSRSTSWTAVVQRLEVVD